MCSTVTYLEVSEKRNTIYDIEQEKEQTDFSVCSLFLAFNS